MTITLIRCKWRRAKSGQWMVRISDDDGHILLPGWFRKRRLARAAAQAVAILYRLDGQGPVRIEEEHQEFGSKEELSLGT